MNTTNPPLCRCCRTEPCKINPQTGEYGKKCKKCAKRDSERTLAKYYERKQKAMDPAAKLAYALLEAERKLNDDLVAENRKQFLKIKELTANIAPNGLFQEENKRLSDIITGLEKENKKLKTSERVMTRQREDLSNVNKLARQLENDNVDLLTQIDDLKEQVRKLKEKYEPDGTDSPVSVVPEAIPPAVA